MPYSLCCHCIYIHICKKCAEYMQKKIGKNFVRENLMHNVIRRKKRNKINYASRISMDVVVMGSGYFLSAIDFVPWYMKRKAIGEISLLWQELNMAYIYEFIICRYILSFINTHSKLSLFYQMCIILILKYMTTNELHVSL